MNLIAVIFSNSGVIYKYCNFNLAYLWYITGTQKIQDRVKYTRM